MSDSLTPLASAVDIAAGALISIGALQRRTIPATTPPASYILSLHGPQAPFLPLFLYVFPLSPQSMVQTSQGLGSYYDVAGSPTNFGVNRIVDIYGMSPPVYEINGTTGVKYHSADGYVFTGLQSVLLLRGLIAQYFSLNAAAAQAGQTDMYTLEFYDYYSDQFWQVVPLGPVALQQSAARPQLYYYSLRLVATQSLEQPIAAAADDLLSSVSIPGTQANTALSSSTSSALGSYSPTSIGQGGLY